MFQHERVYYLVANALSKKELGSLGIEFYSSFYKKVEIKVWPFKLEVDKSDGVFINLLPKNRKTFSTFLGLCSSPAQTVELRTNAVPVGPGRLGSRLRKFTPARLLDFIIRQPFIWQRLAGIPGRIIYGGAVMRPGSGECRRAISAHALDYDVWLEFLAERGIAPEDFSRAEATPGQKSISTDPAIAPLGEPDGRSVVGSFTFSGSKHIVFLDQNLPFHGDFTLQKRRAPATAEKYFPALCQFFDRLEQELGLPVVIAAHPRAAYAQEGYSGPDYFGRRKLIAGQTLPLIFDSALVLTHYSTAVNFAVMAKKPLVLLDSSEIERSEGHIIRSMSSHLGALVLNIDQPGIPLPEELVRIDSEAYTRYFHNYIKEEGSPEKPFWQILLDDLQNNPL